MRRGAAMAGKVAHPRHDLMLRPRHRGDTLYDVAHGRAIAHRHRGRGVLVQNVLEIEGGRSGDGGDVFLDRIAAGCDLTVNEVEPLAHTLGKLDALGKRVKKLKSDQ